jgi:hypothetical protein
VHIKHKIGYLIARLIAGTLPPRLLFSPRYFTIWESKGYHILPVHYESPIPSSSDLNPELWRRPSGLTGIDMRDSDQLRLLKIFKTSFKAEYDAFPRSRTGDGQLFHLNNGWFEKVDAEMLYSFVRHLRPKRMIEIGSGATTLLSAVAIRKNQQEDGSYQCRFTCVEPTPVRLDISALPPNFNVIVSPAQAVQLDLFRELNAGDILFIDSSHVCRTGSDVNWELLEIVPSLNPGVLVHFHDIFIPWEYPESWVVGSRRFLNEQYLLQAFLTFNHEFEIVWSSYHMLRSHPEELDAAFDSFSVDITPPGTFLPGSFWIRRKGG